MSNRSEGEGEHKGEREVGVERPFKRQRGEGGNGAGVDGVDLGEIQKLPAAEDAAAKDAAVDDAQREYLAGREQEQKRQKMLRTALDIHVLKAPRAEWIWRGAPRPDLLLVYQEPLY